MARDEGLHPKAGAIASLIDEEIPIAVQHYCPPGPVHAPRLWPVCGEENKRRVWGQNSSMPIGITCTQCQAWLAGRSLRKSRATRTKRAS